MKPWRLICWLSAPASRKSLESRSSLSMADSPNRNCMEFCRVVLGAKAACLEDEPQNLRVGLGCPARKEIQESGHKEAAEQAVQQVKDGRSHGDRDKEQLSLRAQDSEWPVEGSIDRVGAFRHKLCRSWFRLRTASSGN